MTNADWYAPFAKTEEELRPIVQRAIDSVLLTEVGRQPTIHAHLFYGAIGIDPKHLAIWYLFKTDSEKELSDASGQMKRIVDNTLKALADFKYPYQAVGRERICFASEEEIQRAGGHREFFQ